MNEILTKEQVAEIEYGYKHGDSGHNTLDLCKTIELLRAALEKSEAWNDLMVDEFKRIRAIQSNVEDVRAEVKGLCDRAIKNTYQHVPVIQQRDEAEQKLQDALSRLAEMRTAMEGIGEMCAQKCEAEIRDDQSLDIATLSTNLKLRAIAADIRLTAYTKVQQALASAREDEIKKGE